jgi:hypothetical protein
LKDFTKAGWVVCAYNPSTWEADAGGLQVQGQLGYIVKPCLKKRKYFIIK